jgi:hypothetical protein
MSPRRRSPVPPGCSLRSNDWSASILSIRSSLHCSERRLSVIRTEGRRCAVAEHTRPIHRHLYMTKSWIALRPWIALVIIVVGMIWFVSRLKSEEPTQLYPATINRDCAPWDGMAFTVSIPWMHAATLGISIYQSPQILHPVTFHFPMKHGGRKCLPSATRTDCPSH